MKNHNIMLLESPYLMSHDHFSINNSTNNQKVHHIVTKKKPSQPVTANVESLSYEIDLWTWTWPK